jgi:drug/metabolite transporter (DMT)-like permease
LERIKSYIPHILLFIVNLIYGANYSIAKAVMPRFILPFGFIFYRVTISLTLYALLYFCFIREKIDRIDWIRIGCCGFFGIALNQLLFFKGISLTSSIHGALLMITSPIITYIISRLLLKERLQKIKILGIVLGACGAAILIFSSFKEIGTASVNGDLLVALNAISFSIYLILVKPLMQKYQPLTIAFLCFLSGSIWVVLIGYDQAMAVDFRAIPSQYYWNFGFVILAATFIVYLFNNIAIRSVSATTVSSYIYLQPFFAILISLLFTDEKLTFYSCLGGFFIIFGLWLINHKKT